MSTKDHDTDPSTPGAKQRLSEPNATAAPVARDDGAPPVKAADGRGLSERQGFRPGTDPGVAPPAPPRAAPAQPMGIVVPSPSAPPGKPNDSVDLLLDGIPEDALNRSRTTSQTDGQASAVYHTQHGVRAARALVADEPKVVVERPGTLPPARLQRSKVPKAGQHVEASLLGPQDVTVVTGPPMGSRLMMAIAAGLLVVVGIFGLLKLTSETRLAGATTAPPPSPSTSRAPAAVASSRGATPIPTAASAPAAPAASVVDLRPSPTAAPEPSASPVGLVSAAPPPLLAKTAALPARPPKARPKPAATTAPAWSAGGDLGEFKTSF